MTFRPLAALVARYDRDVMRPPGPPVAAGGMAEIPRRQVLAWCFDGTGTGRRPFLRPGARPDVGRGFSVAVLAGGDGAGRSSFAEALCRELDGTPLLEACSGRWSGLALRLGVKLKECRWWRPRHPEDPWDSGFLLGGAAALERLAAFRPRRATLLVADELPPGFLRRVVRVLGEKADGYRQPVRLLILAAAPAPWQAEFRDWPVVSLT